MPTASRYKVLATDVCSFCHYAKNSEFHYRMCIPAYRWPAEMQVPHKKRVVINGRVYDADKVPQDDLQGPPKPPESHGETEVALSATETKTEDSAASCECGYVTAAKNPANAIRLHKMNSKAHRA